jgi:hypothetical protein
MSTTPKTGLALLREPFPPNQISKLPKPLRKDAPKGKCQECGGWHGLPAVHLDYVGHAALTARLLDSDITWRWEPVGFDDKGLPALDANGGLWIKLTVCGVTRMGYGDAQGKTGPDAMKERIGDALRNAAMRFGAALDLWHKGDLYAHEQEQGERLPHEVAEHDAVSDRHAALMTPITDERETVLKLAASAAIVKFKKGDQIGAYEEISGITERAEKNRLWQYLKDEPKLRAFIQEHAQMLRETEAI